jgi:hypothetical protein
MWLTYCKNEGLLIFYLLLHTLIRNLKINSYLQEALDVTIINMVNEKKIINVDVNYFYKLILTSLRHNKLSS